jgi:NAD(P)-dependent dehydrogenase (short-subunit alcohol dehydrogenase family)
MFQDAAEGARFVLADHVEPDEPAAGLTGARFVRTDVGEEAGIRALARHVLVREGCIDVFVSNAGMTIGMDALALEDDWQRIIAVNQMSHVWAARHVLPHMLDRGRGRFLVTASASSFLSELLSVGYAVTKSAAYAFAEWLAFSYRSRGIAVSAIVPGPVWTPPLDAAPYLHPLTIPADLAVERIFEQLREGRFLITTHPASRKQFAQKAADIDAYVTQLATLREQVPQ